MHFAKHETFHIRDGWLYKGLIAIEKSPSIFLSDDAPEILGLGTNMVRALRFWLQATGLTEETWDNRSKAQYATSFGRLVRDNDPYLELDGTIWLLHHSLVSSNDLATSWYWFFNLYAPVGFTRADFVENISHWINTQEDSKAQSISERSLQRDFDCLVRTYLPSRRDRSPEDQLESPLSVLGLLESSREYDEDTGKAYQHYRMQSVDTASIPPLVFLYVLLNRQNCERKGARQVNLGLAMREPKNVGRTFNIGMLSLEKLLGKLSDKYPEWQIQIARAGGLDQLTLPAVDPEKVLETYYEDQSWL